jgi:hypothetical protein
MLDIETRSPIRLEKIKKTLSLRALQTCTQLHIFIHLAFAADLRHDITGTKAMTFL